MPWNQTDRVTERRKYVLAVLRRDVSIGELWQRFGISRKTGYKMQARHAELVLLAPAGIRVLAREAGRSA